MLLTGLGILTELGKESFWKGIGQPDPRVDVWGCLGLVFFLLCMVLAG